MKELPTAIPDVSVLLALEPEELGAKLLFLLRERDDIKGVFRPDNLIHELWRQNDGFPRYPNESKAAVRVALKEAMAWLEAQGLIIEAIEDGQNPGYKFLSRRARRFENEAEFVNYAVARRLPKETLHPRISGSVWMSFMRGEFDIAVLQAMKAVEVAVREAAGLTDADFGTHLMRKAFDPNSGMLTDKTVELAEREALSHLFAGSIGSYKNPHSHRQVGLDDPAEAAEIVMLANHLLRIVDARSPRKNLP